MFNYKSVPMLGCCYTVQPFMGITALALCNFLLAIFFIIWDDTKSIARTVPRSITIEI